MLKLAHRVILCFLLFSLVGCVDDYRNCNEAVSKKFSSLSLFLIESNGKSHYSKQVLDEKRLQLKNSLNKCNKTYSIHVEMLGDISRLELILMTFDIGYLQQYVNEKGVEYFLSYRNSFDESALHIAARSGGADAIKLFLDLGLDIDLKDKFGATPLLTAIDNNISNNNAILLIDEGAKIGSKSFNGYTPLSLAKQKNNIELLEYIKQRNE